MVNNIMKQNMPIGTKVMVKDTCRTYDRYVNGCIGFVRLWAHGITSDMVGVKLPGLSNSLDMLGYFWFYPEDLEVIYSLFSIEEPQKKVNVDLFAIKNVCFINPVTVVMWEDGTKTIVRCGKNDIYDPEKGLAMAIAKKALNNKSGYYDEFKKWLPKDCSTCCYESYEPTALPCCNCTLANDYKYYKHSAHKQDDDKSQHYVGCIDCKYYYADCLSEPCYSCMTSEKDFSEFVPCDF